MFNFFFDIIDLFLKFIVTTLSVDPELVNPPNKVISFGLVDNIIAPSKPR